MGALQFSYLTESPLASGVSSCRTWSRYRGSCRRANSPCRTNAHTRLLDGHVVSALVIHAFLHSPVLSLGIGFYPSSSCYFGPWIDGRQLLVVVPIVDDSHES